LLWRCRCTHRQRDGEECGREVLAPGRQLQSGWRKSCGHHRRGTVTKTFFKKNRPFPRRLVDDEGRGWLLPNEAAKELGLARLRRDRMDGIEQKYFSVGLGDQQRVGYLSEKDVQDAIARRSRRETLPQVDDHLDLASSAKKLKRSVNHVRMVARTVLGETLPTFAAKDEHGRSCVKTYVPLAVHEKLKAHFAGAPIPEPDPAPVAIRTAENARQENPPRKQRGRPEGSKDPQVADRIRKMLEAWDRGDFQNNKAAAGRAYSFNRPDASKIISAHEEAKRRNNSAT
jgi:hypothetical protein